MSHDALLLLCVLNALDLVLTVVVLSLGATEANPLLASAWDRSAIVFVAAKLGLAGFGLGVLWRYRRLEAVRLVAFAGCLVFGVVICVHVAVLVHLLC